MRTGGTTALTARGACLAAGLAFCLVAAQAEVPIRIVIGDDAVKITASNASIKRVLEELSLRTSLVIVSQDPLEELVSVDISEPTLPGVIHRLLRQKSYLLHRLSPVPGSARYTRLWIFSADQNDGEQSWAVQPTRRPQPNDERAISAYQVMALSDDGGDREEAMYGIGEIGGIGAIAYLRQGLVDPDRRVRAASIEALAAAGDRDSVHLLGDVLADPDASLRIDAVDALGEIGGREAMRILQGAITDENRTVREAAAEWLTELSWRND